MATSLALPPALGEMAPAAKSAVERFLPDDAAVGRHALPASLQSIWFKVTPYTVTVCVPDRNHDVLTAERWCGAVSR